MDNEIIMAFVKEIPILIVGLTVAGFVHFLQNRTKVIINKAWIEGKKKLDIENIIEIINGTKDLKLAVAEVDYYIKLLEEKAIIATYSGGIDRVYKALYKTQDIYISSSKKIENFIFLLERDIIINDKTQVAEEEIENIKNINKKMGKAVMNEELKAVKDIGWQGSIFETIEEFSKVNSNKEIKKSIERILKVYKEKLN